MTISKGFIYTKITEYGGTNTFNSLYMVVILVQVAEHIEPDTR